RTKNRLNGRPLTFFPCYSLHAPREQVRVLAASRWRLQIPELVFPSTSTRDTRAVFPVPLFRGSAPAADTCSRPQSLHSERGAESAFQALASLARRFIMRFNSA